MSYATISTSTSDNALAQRIGACAGQEAFRNPNVHDTPYAIFVREFPYGQPAELIWAVATTYEAEYASALASGNPNPGGDEGVITDGMILSAVQANWPPKAPGSP